MMVLSDVLEIVIPTYNRAKTLKKTLDTLLFSPVCGCKITVLDNNSTDKTYDTVEILMNEYPNLKYIKNRYNLGLAGNICKSLTIPEKKYFWIIFDDTGLDFSNWSYVEKGLDVGADCVLTTNYYNVTDLNDLSDRAAVFLMMIYCFAGIYKTNLITDNVILYALTDIYTVHSQMALVSAVFNDNKKIYLPEKTVTFPQMNPETERGEGYSFNRSDRDFFHFRISGNDFVSGFVCAIQSLADKSLKEKVLQLLFSTYHGFGPYAKIEDRRNKILQKKLTVNYLDELFFCKDIYQLGQIEFTQKKAMIYLKKTEKDIRIVLFGRIEIKIWKFL